MISNVPCGRPPRRGTACCAPAPARSPSLLLRRGAACCALVLLTLAGCVTAKPSQGTYGVVSEDGEQVDRLGLAALLIKDGHVERARTVLDEVDAKQPGLDLARFHTLRGLVALQAHDHAAARDELAAATRTGQVEPIVWVYLAQAHHAAGEPAAAIQALEGSRAAWEPIVGVHRLKVLCHWATGDHAGAFAALSTGERRFPGDAEFTKQRVLYLLELQLYQEAADAGEAYLERAGRTTDAHLALGEALRRAKKPDDAARVLEAARLRAPGHERVLVALAHAHLDAGRPRAAAVVLEEAARIDARYLGEAAELHRRAGALDRALYLNAQVIDQKAKTRQRLGLLLQRAAYDGVQALEPRLSRLGLMEDEEVRYALAYASYRAGDLARADARLRGITRPDLFRAATDLRKAIEVERLDEADRK